MQATYIIRTIFYYMIFNKPVLCPMKQESYTYTFMQILYCSYGKMCIRAGTV